MTKNYPTWSIYLLLVFGIVTILFGAWIIYRAVKVKNFGLQTKGTVVEYHSQPKNPQGTFGKHTMVHSPVFCYITEDNIKYTSRSTVSDEEKPYEIGETITIVYDAVNPKNAFIVDSYPWKEGAIILILGILSFIYLIIELKKRI